ncbi:MAG TPA: tRNA (N(6)-L-threonylcarbamoyladenosine(37)-C(2))-methylthiotransferase MtaB [Geminicoccaceae bacterium]|nr:tRNA (N(6)-L-threonylcarbamoyladenosine(37)-C(2))-methylthiotransferase MtaB [Geminicoccaceae bacterium]
MSARVVTFGCRLNSFESEVMRSHAAAAGLEDTVIVHTCAVTAEAERQARQAIRRLRREKPGARIVVTGCSAQLDPQRYAAMPEVDRVVGNDRKLDPDLWRDLAGGEPIVVGDIMAVRETAGHLVDGLDGRSRAFVQVQNGCDHRCTFCIIPYGRGPSRSIPMGRIAEQVRALATSGVREVVLTGVDLTSYGKDLPGQPTLGGMVKRLLRLVPELDRLRLSSIDPAEVDRDLLDLVGGEPRLMPHLHLSVQAGDTLILKRMKRRHGRDDVVDLCVRLRALRPDIVFGADLIAGFPTETEAMFANTLALVEDAGLTYLHVFPYSARRGTPAARMPQVAKEARRERAARLRAAGARALSRYLAGRLGRTERVLVERGGGRTEGFAPFRIDGAAPPAGSIVAVRADRLAGAELAGPPL